MQDQDIRQVPAVILSIAMQLWSKTKEKKKERNPSLIQQHAIQMGWKSSIGRNSQHRTTLVQQKKLRRR